MRSIIEAILKTAGDIIITAYGQSHAIDYKGTIDIVTETDQQSEHFILMALNTNFPEIPVISEETRSGYHPLALERCFYVDPLDGTTNFAHNYPLFAVTIGLIEKGEAVLGAVYEPLRSVMYFAQKGQGSWCNNCKIKVSALSELNNSLLATGFPYNRRTNGNNNLAAFEKFFFTTQGIRRSGSACLDLCHVAAGYLDGYWEMGLSPWDYVAGSIIVTEAGGMVSNYRGQLLDYWSGEIIASNGLIHNALIEILT